MAKSRFTKDPFAEREADTYENPIPSREYILQFFADQDGPVEQSNIAEAFSLDGEVEVEALQRRLRAMVRDGQILQTRNQRYGLVKKMNLVRGRIVARSDGSGMVVTEKGVPDLFLNSSQMRTVFPEDKVLAAVVGVDRRGREEATVVEILERGYTHVIGRLMLEKGMAWVVPQRKTITQDIRVAPDSIGSAQSGDIVELEITDYPSKHRGAVGRVVKLLGQHMAPGMEVDIALRNYSIPHEWSTAVKEEIKAFPETVTAEAASDRKDLTQLSFVTIDGEDAQDFDDAVFCEPHAKGGWRLLVAIADVSHYVKPGTALDEEAYLRGNSVYFPDAVVPMLPERLSNDLCSLNPKVRRLCMTCEMHISAQGELLNADFYPAVLCSAARLTYTDVGLWLVDEPDLLPDNLREPLTNLESLYNVLLNQRSVRGAIDFDLPELRIVFGDQKKIEKIVPVTRNIAHRIIEECMLIANVAAAELCERENLPALYRIHDKPSQEKLTDVRAFLAELMLTLKGGDKPRPKDYAQILSQVKDRPDAHLIQTVLLRSMSLSVYSPDNIGHFGLAYEAYAHFTSPIRRYPDLMLHRLLHQHCKSKKKNMDKLVKVLEASGEHCSMTERRADDATRDVVDWLKCEYIMDKVGETFPGVITAVKGFGLFVELKDIYVEGLIHISALQNDYYTFDAASHILRGERTGQKFRLGDPIEVRVSNVNLDERKIDFTLANVEAPVSKKPKRRRRKPKSQRGQV